MKITFAFALNNEGIFEKRHFGEADKFSVYTFENNKLSFVDEWPNSFKTIDETKKHGSHKKGEAIIEFLKEKSVTVLVSKQFGKNLKMVNQHFIPVIIAEYDPEKVLKILLKRMDWFKDELKNRKTNFMLFRIKNGILKMDV